MSAPFKIRITTEADTSGVDKAEKALKGAGKAADDLNQKSGNTRAFGGAFREALDQVPGVNRLTSALGGTANLLKALAGLAVGMGVAFVGAAAKMISTGVQFNSTLEDAKLGIAAVLRQFDDTGKFASFDDAMAASGEAIDLLKQKAIESPASFEQLVQAFQGTAGAMAASGMDIGQQVNTIVTMSQTLAGLGIRSEQILQETRAILTGNITEDAAAARILGITQDMVAAAKAEGKLYEFLQQRMASFAEAGVRSSETLSTKMSNLGDSFQQLSGQLSKPFFESLKNSADEAQKALNAVQKAIDFFSPPEPKVAEAIDEIAEAAEKAEQETRKLNNTRVNALQQSAENAEKAFESLAAQIRSTAQQADDLDEAQTGRQLAEVDRDEQNKLAAAGANEPEKERIQEDANRQRREIQSARQGRRTVRTQDAETQIANEIERQISEKGNEAAQAANESQRAITQTSQADREARSAGVWPEFDLAKGNEAKFLSRLAEDIKAAREVLKSTEAKWFGETGRMNPEQSEREISEAKGNVSGLERKQDAARSLVEARNYQATAEENSTKAGDHLESFKSSAAPKLEQSRTNIERLSIEEQTRLLKENAEAEKAAIEAREREDARRIEALENQKALQSEQNETALKELQVRAATEKEIAEARASGNEAVRVIEEEIAKIRGTTETQAAIAAERRKQDALGSNAPGKSEGADRRRQSGETGDGLLQPQEGLAGEIIPGTNRRRGAITSDTFEQPVSVLSPAAPLTNFQADLAPRGAAEAAGPSVQPNAASSGITYKDSGSVDAANKVREALQEESAKVAGALSDIAALIPQAGRAAMSATASIKQQVQALKQQLDALKGDI